MCVCIFTHITFFFVLALRHDVLGASPLHLEWSCMCEVENSLRVDNLKP